MGFLLQFIECVYACPCFGASRLRHTAHPVQLRAVQALGLLYLRALVVLAFSLLLYIIVVGAAVVVELAVVKLDDVLAHIVKKIAVVCHHKDGQPLLAQKLFQPFNHSYVEVVGRLVEQQ